MTLIALTGGIASGKSTIGDRLEALGATRIDADVLSREAVEPETDALSRIREIFGEEVIAADGTLDRQALGTIVFGDSENLDTLNRIVHPAVRELFAQRVAAARADDPQGIIVYEIPLLVESGGSDTWDMVVVADAPAETRMERLRDHRGLTRTEAEHRVRSQASDDERRAIADVLIDTSGTLQHTLAQVDALWARLAPLPGS